MSVTSLRWVKNRHYTTYDAMTEEEVPVYDLVTVHGDGYVKHWNISDYTLGHTIAPENKEENLLTIDYTRDYARFATAGKEREIRVYDEETKSLMCELKATPKENGHSSRIFCVKFSTLDPNMLVSGGWDNKMIFYDLRVHKPVLSILGPHVSGESIDFHPKDGKVLVGACKEDNML